MCYQQIEVGGNSGYVKNTPLPAVCSLPLLGVIFSEPLSYPETPSKISINIKKCVRSVSNLVMEIDCSLPVQQLEFRSNQRQPR